MLTWIVLFVTGVLCGFALCLFMPRRWLFHLQYFRHTKQRKQRAAVITGKHVTGLQLTTVSGESFVIADDGRVKILHFWTPGCGPCNTSMPNIQWLRQYIADKPMQLISVVHGVDDVQQCVADYQLHSDDSTTFCFVREPYDKSELGRSLLIHSAPIFMVTDSKNVITVPEGHPGSLCAAYIDDLLQPSGKN